MPFARGAKGALMRSMILGAGLSLVSVPAAAESNTVTTVALQEVERSRPIATFFSRLFNRQQALIAPILDAVLTSGFGMRRNPILGAWALHAGVDLSAPRGTPIQAAGDGIVVSAERESGYGYTTRIHHDDGVETVYAHQSRIAEGIVPGTEIRQGQIIGLVGATGNATSPHLHVEIWINGEPVDPLGADLRQAGLIDG